MRIVIYVGSAAAHVAHWAATVSATNISQNQDREVELLSGLGIHCCTQTDIGGNPSRSRTGAIRH